MIFHSYITDVLSYRTRVLIFGICPMKHLTYSSLDTHTLLNSPQEVSSVYNKYSLLNYQSYLERADSYTLL